MARPWAALTPRGGSILTGGAVVLVAGLWWRYPVLAGLGGVLVALVAVEIVAVLRSPDVTVWREVSPLVVVRHETCTGTLHVAGRRRSGLVRIDVADLVDGTQVPLTLRDGPEAGTVSVDYPVATPRRGLVPVGPVVLRRSGLAGLASLAAEVGPVEHVRVLPRRVPVAALVPGRHRANAGGEASLDNGGTDLVGLHEYAMGDDLRRLHWATSARSGILVVREDAEPSEPHVCVVLDDRVESYTDPGTPGEQFEEAVELAAALCRAVIEAGSPLRFRNASGALEVDVPGSANGSPRLEGREIDWLLAEIATVGTADLPPIATRDLDVAVAVTGGAVALREVALALGEAPTRIVALVDPSAAVSTGYDSGLLVLRGATSTMLASLWDSVAVR